LPAQEMAIKFGYSFLLNTEHFRKFAEAYNSAVEEKMNSLSDEEFERIKVENNLNGEK
jgi:hypothetical protein